MSVRPKINPNFAGTVCELTLPEGVEQVQVGDHSIRLPSSAPSRIVVFGDTGCRVNGKVVQNCHSDSLWPLVNIAKAAADWRPDLVIHVGDYHYRETPCPRGNSACKGSVSGDQWDSWMQDFFRPAAPLLSTAPWVFVRGNHELCSRAGNGWFQFLEPRPLPASCTDRTDPYVIPLGDHTLAVVDAADDKNIQRSLNKLKTDDKSTLWLAQHRPFLTPGADDEASSPSYLPPTLASPGKLSLVLVGHKHAFSLNQFSNDLPPEIITGNGGTSLDSFRGSRYQVIKPRDGEVSMLQYHDFGFLTFERQANDTWLMTERDLNGKAVLSCLLTESNHAQTRLKCGRE
jgi:hypothetical protein